MLHQAQESNTEATKCAPPEGSASQGLWHQSRGHQLTSSARGAVPGALALAHRRGERLPPSSRGAGAPEGLLDTERDSKVGVAARGHRK